MVLYSGALRIYCASKTISITRLDKQLNSSCTAHLLKQTLLCAQNFKSSWILRTEVRVWPFTRLENTTENSWYLRAGNKRSKKVRTHDRLIFYTLQNQAVDEQSCSGNNRCALRPRCRRWRCMHLYCRSMNSRSPILVMMYCSPLLVLVLDRRWM